MTFSPQSQNRRGSRQLKKSNPLALIIVLDGPGKYTVEMYQEDPNRCVLWPELTRLLREEIGRTESYYHSDDEQTAEWAQYSIVSSSTSIQKILDVFEYILERRGWVLDGRSNNIVEATVFDGNFVWDGKTIGYTPAVPPRKLLFEDD